MIELDSHDRPAMKNLDSHDSRLAMIELDSHDSGLDFHNMFPFSFPFTSKSNKGVTGPTIFAGKHSDEELSQGKNSEQNKSAAQQKIANCRKGWLSR
eukprot:1352098-Rhodomonas_salina.2